MAFLAGLASTLLPLVGEIGKSLIPTIAGGAGSLLKTISPDMKKNFCGCDDTLKKDDFKVEKQKMRGDYGPWEDGTRYNDFDESLIDASDYDPRLHGEDPIDNYKPAGVQIRQDGRHKFNPRRRNHFKTERRKYRL